MRPMGDALREQLAYLPDYLSRHMTLTVASILIGTAISVPLGLFAVRVRRVRGPLLGIASILQTIPGLAMLAYMAVLFSLFGFLPALLACVLYSILPILRNTVTGIEQVDERVVEASRGMGMTENQILTRIQLPLALPVIIAGIRTATVWTVGLATIATPIGATSLGNFIFSGLQTQNNVAVTVGCISAAILALLLDGLIRLSEYAAETRSGKLGTLAAAGLLGVLSAGLVPQALENLGGDRIYVGAKGFTEQYILAEVIKRQLEDAGYNVEVRQNLGSGMVFNAVKDNNISVYVDYTGTIWTNQMKREDNPGPEEMLRIMRESIAAVHGVRTGAVLGFENAYALAMRADVAQAKGIETIDDLAAQDSEIVMGSDYEFFSRPEWYALREAYNLELKEQKSFDPALMYSAAADGEVDVITAFSTDGRIIAYDLTILDDTRHAFPPYDAIVLVSPEASEDAAFMNALRPLDGAISDEAMREANKLVDVDKRPVRAAADYLMGLINTQRREDATD
jgi:osmoprotectant transport system permease protein